MKNPPHEIDGVAAFANDGKIVVMLSIAGSPPYKSIFVFNDMPLALRFCTQIEHAVHALVKEGQGDDPDSCVRITEEKQ
jgi:hypothetical protein